MFRKVVSFFAALLLINGETLSKDAATIKQELSGLLSQGRKVRVAWSQISNNVGTLYGVDSDDGQIKELTPASLFSASGRHVTAPFITRDGRRVVFAEEKAGTIYVIDWNGTGLRRLASGTCAGGTWQDPSNPTKQYAIIDRSIVNIDNTSETKVVAPFGLCLVGDNDGSGISVDGLRYGGFLCQGNSGIAPTPSGQAVCNRCGGCNFAMRPTVGVYEYGHFPPGGHETIHIHNADGSLKQNADVSSTVKGCTSGEPVNLVWSNDPDVVVYQWQECRNNPVLFRLSDKKSVTIRDDLQNISVGGVDAVFLSATGIENDVVLRKALPAWQSNIQGVAYSPRGQKMPSRFMTSACAQAVRGVAIVVKRERNNSAGAVIVY